MTARAARYSASLVVQADHPALSGHFPGNPVVPGVLLLDRVLEALEAVTCQPVRLRRLRHVKFLAPLLPGEVAEISIEASVDLLTFAVHRSDQAIATGTFELEDGEKS